MLKTSEIYKVLKRFETQDPQQQKSKPSERQIYQVLEARNLIGEAKLTPKGSKLLIEYEGLAKKYGKGNVEIIPANAEGDGNYIFKAVAKPIPKEKIKSTTISDDEFAKSLEGLKYFESVYSKKDRSICIDTKIPFRRTIPEIKKLEEFASLAGVSFKPGYSVYTLGSINIVTNDTGSKNMTKPSKDHREKLTIKLEPGDLKNEASRMLVKKILQEYRPYNPLA